METEQRIKIHQAVEYIKQDPEFPFDTHDELQDILEYYKITMPTDPELKNIIERDIATIAGQQQTKEISRIVGEDDSLGADTYGVSTVGQLDFCGGR